MGVLPLQRDAVVFYSSSQLNHSLRGRGSYSSAEMQLLYSTAPANWSTLCGVRVLPLCRDVLGVFYRNVTKEKEQGNYLKVTWLTLLFPQSAPIYLSIYLSQSVPLGLSIEEKVHIKHCHNTKAQSLLKMPKQFLNSTFLLETVHFGSHVLKRIRLLGSSRAHVTCSISKAKQPVPHCLANIKNGPFYFFFDLIAKNFFNDDICCIFFFF